MRTLTKWTRITLLCDIHMRRTFIALLMLFTFCGFALVAPLPGHSDNNTASGHPTMSIEEHAVDLMGFYGKIAIASVLLCGSLITYIFITGISGVKEILKGDVNALGIKINALDTRVSVNEGRITTLESILREDVITKDIHNAMCDKKIP